MGTLLYFWLGNSYLAVEQVYLVVIQVSIIMVFIPICFFYLLRTMGKVSSIMLHDVAQRKLPLAIQIVLTALLLAKSVTADVLPELYHFFFGGMVSSALALMLALVRIKASLHQMGMAALWVFTIGLSVHSQTNALYLVAALTFLNGIVAASRLQMEAHTGKELLIGGLCGLLPQLVIWPYWL